MSQRTDRVDELLRQEIGALLRARSQDPRIGFVTVTEVETTPDLRHARVWVSVIGDAPSGATTLAALERAMPFVRHELGVRLRIRRIPALHVVLDDSLERATRVLQDPRRPGAGREPARVAPAASRSRRRSPACAATATHPRPGGEAGDLAPGRYPGARVRPR